MNKFWNPKKIINIRQLSPKKIAPWKALSILKKGQHCANIRGIKARKSAKTVESNKIYANFIDHN